MNSTESSHVRAAIVGASGYTGAELVRLIAGHPRLSLAWVGAQSNAGKRLGAVLEALDPEDRALLLMKYMEDMSVKEMMEVLELGESAVKMRMLRARERALGKYRELYPEEA